MRDSADGLAFDFCKRQHVTSRLREPGSYLRRPENPKMPIVNPRSYTALMLKIGSGADCIL